MKNYDFLSCHFHKVDSLTWLRIREVLNSMLLARLEASSEVFTWYMPQGDWDTIRLFVEQMDTAYIHPRRDAYHVNFLQSVYTNLHLPANFFRKKSGTKFDLACPSQEKKPKSISNVSEDRVAPSSVICSFVALALLFLFAFHLNSIFGLC